MQTVIQLSREEMEAPTPAAAKKVLLDVISELANYADNITVIEYVFKMMRIIENEPETAEEQPVAQ